MLTRPPLFRPLACLPSVSWNEADITLVHALVAGPEGTPYQGGFFLFVLRFPADYPSRPPKVKLLSTHHGQIRFNPNRSVGAC